MDDYNLHEQDWEEFIKRGREAYGLTAADHVGCVRVHEDPLHVHRRRTNPPRSIYATAWR
ncbi:hypothetical protein [Paenibacillus shenyangensis]|uniref:hypothetical protein n=1 Tax=Paenibacillus sp. A9 TaxID=1284352 RepID=UPI001EE6CED8|nr:hypothetical protein [Paenibacillus sp. A9]